LKGALLLMTLMNDKYLLHIINEIISVVGLLKKYIYISISVGRLLPQIWIIHVIILEIGFLSLGY
jgi:hypothetical protein